MNQPLSDHVLVENHDVWQAMQAHRFVADIEHDRLDPAVFRRYLAYENAFVEAAVRIFAHLTAKAPGLGEQRRLIAVQRALVDEQIAYFRAAFDELGMTEAMWRDLPLPEDVREFRDGMLEIVAAGSYADGIAAMFAAEWMYWTWCDRAARKPIGDPVLRRWVDLHAADDFKAQAAWLRGELDRAGEGMDTAARVRCSSIFGRALSLEIAFHNAAYSG